MTAALELIEKAEIASLLCPRLTATGRAQIVGALGTVPVTFTEETAGVVRAAFRAAMRPACPEVQAYTAIAARACDCYRRETPDGEVWLETSLSTDGPLVRRVADFARMARSIADAATWLQEDATSRTWWSIFAADHIRKKGERDA